MKALLGDEQSLFFSATMTAHPVQAKGTGVTITERYLRKLCEKSFLSLWSYPGVHNNKGPGQEVCDLLVVFENHVIVFSDKNCAYVNTGNLENDWKRWYRKAIDASIKQIFGAERWIRNHPSRLFLDQACKVPFPIPLPAEPIFHRIIVTHGIAEPCRKFFNGGTGSLLFDSECISSEIPFTIGQVGGARGVVHVLDDSSLNIVLQTLDTAPDFIEYLVRKERFLTSGLSIASAGEEEFLGHYLEFQDDKGDHDFLINVDLGGADRIVFDEGFWQGFSQHKSRRIQIEANRISYFWDSLIEKITSHIVEGTEYASSGADLETQERLLRLLAKENRTKRRFLSDLFLQFVKKVPDGFRSTRRVLPPIPGDPFYVFFVLPYHKGTDYDKYRFIRREFLAYYCTIIKLDYPQAYDIIGIATESGMPDGRSEDLVYIDTRNWTAKDRKRAQEDKEFLIAKGYLARQHRFSSTLYEYPETPERLKLQLPDYSKGRERNAPCFCGSGRKAKKCHGASAT